MAPFSTRREGIDDDESILYFHLPKNEANIKSTVKPPVSNHPKCQA